MIITGDDLTGIWELKKLLSCQFEMKDLGPLNYFLGLEITAATDGYYLTQAKCISDLLSKSGLFDSKIIDTPLEHSTRLNLHYGKSLRDGILYRQLVGSLVYLTATLPDISNAVHIVSQFMAAPRSTHFAAVISIFRYLKGTKFYGLYFSSQLPCRSITGYYFCLSDLLISWRSKNKLWLLDLAQKSNIGHLLILCLRFCGYVGSFRT
ncbi:uncharacterized mitochondrial protein AtMg00810-like [Cornus florida]|uniref:uncharacterized mitochondrial protein AtMg00810-like n=1 Tax=Cornus florida TaxID=4283 RepID=UPI00289C59A1|nr:uncharacterized mitochondrial protein AtMg00810-like [Cornus florida]